MVGFYLKSIRIKKILEIIVFIEFFFLGNEICFMCLRGIINKLSCVCFYIIFVWLIKDFRKE